MKLLRIFLLLVLLLTPILPSSVPLVSAQTTNEDDTEVEIITPPPAGINITMSPTFINLVADPGETVESSIRIRNNNNFREAFQIETKTFDPNTTGESPVIREPNSNDEFVSWATFSEDEFILEPNEEIVVDVAITTPTDASLGYYYAFLITRQNERDDAGLGAQVSGGTAVLALLEVRSENVTRELQIEDFKPTKLFYEYLPAELEVSVRNTGNIHVIPVGDVFVDSMTNDEVAVSPVNAGRGNVLPQGTRTFTATFDDGFAVRVPKTDKDGNPVRDRNGNIEYKTHFDFSKMDKFRIGKYEATVILVYDNGERDVPIQATVSFWIIPWKIIGIALIVLILLLLGLKSAVAPVFKRKK